MSGSIADQLRTHIVISPLAKTRDPASMMKTTVQGIGKYLLITRAPSNKWQWFPQPQKLFRGPTPWVIKNLELARTF